MRKDELVKLSKEKGFISKDNLLYPSDAYYYLWMSELKQWLLENHEMNAFVRMVIIEDGLTQFESNVQYDRFREEELDSWDTYNKEDVFPTYTEAFEFALLCSLNYIDEYAN